MKSSPTLVLAFKLSNRVRLSARECDGRHKAPRKCHAVTTRCQRSHISLFSSSNHLFAQNLQSFRISALGISSPLFLPYSLSVSTRSNREGRTSFEPSDFLDPSVRCSEFAARHVTRHLLSEWLYPTTIYTSQRALCI